MYNKLLRHKDLKGTKKQKEKKKELIGFYVCGGAGADSAPRKAPSSRKPPLLLTSWKREKDLSSGRGAESISISQEVSRDTHFLMPHCFPMGGAEKCRTGKDFLRRP